ncbi:hypothetical protein C8R44DRAFT_976489 [Mycena epipterygia]|nr:hypothetical protein C8R44DRAFT_976489 [Mycena epipterygia]
MSRRLFYFYSQGKKDSFVRFEPGSSLAKGPVAGGFMRYPHAAQPLTAIECFLLPATILMDYIPLNAHPIFSGIYLHLHVFDTHGPASIYHPSSFTSPFTTRRTFSFHSSMDSLLRAAKTLVIRAASTTTVFGSEREEVHRANGKNPDPINIHAYTALRPPSRLERER